MNSKENSDERKKLEQVIAALEAQRSILGDEVVDASLGALQKQLEELNSGVEPEQRKLVSILFMDTVGSTEISRSLDPEVNLEIMTAALGRLTTQVELQGGRVLKRMGDGFLAVFGVPVGRENDPDSAVRAGLAILDEAQEYAQELEANHGITGYQVRVGINTGLVAARSQRGRVDISGVEVNLAARLESAADPGSVLVSHNTYQHIRGAFDITPLSPIQVKGFVEPIPIYRVLVEKARSFRTRRRGVEGIETPMIGREPELIALQNAYYAAVEDSEEQVVTIVGEAGLGKSRLLYEFENWVDLQPKGILLFRGRAQLEARHLPYNIIRDLFAFRFGVHEDDPPELIQEKYINGFLQVIEEAETADLMAQVTGYLLGYYFQSKHDSEPTPNLTQQLHDRWLRYMVDYFEAALIQDPVLVLFEDLHWADESSLDVINKLAHSLTDQPIMFLCSARPTLYQRRPHWFEGQTFHSRINLKPLTRRDSRKLVAEALKKVDQVPASMRELLVENAEGNPFYLEELIKVMVDQGIITKGMEQWQVQLDKLSDIVIPTTLSGVLQARLDRLPINERMLLQQASIVGRVFWDSIIYYMNELGFKDSERETIASGLNDLHRKELVFRRELSAFAGSQEHIFKHAILREVTYESVILRLRRKYHNLAAEWLIEQSREGARWQLGLIAEHLELAGRAGDAVDYLIRAGQDAATTYANDEAVNYFNRALTLVRDDDFELRWTILLAREAVYHLQGKREAQKKDLDVLSEVGANLYSGAPQAVLLVRQARYFNKIGDYSEAIIVSRKAVESASASQQLALEAAAYFESSAALFTQEMYLEAGLQAQTCLEKALEAGNRYIEGRIHNILGNIAMYDYDLKSARTHYEKRIEIARDIGDRHGEGYGLGNLGLTYALEMDHETAQKYYELNLAIDREIGDRDDESPCLSNLSQSAYILGEYNAALEYAEQALAIAQETGSPYNQGYALDSLGDALTLLGKLEEALPAYKQAIRIRERLGQSSGIIVLQAGLARTYLAMEDLISASHLADQILEYIKEGGILDRAEWPERVYETVIRVLEITGDPRLGETIISAYDLIQKQSERFSSEASLSLYLNTEWNRKIILLWEQQQE